MKFVPTKTPKLDEVADSADIIHNETTGKQGGTTDEYYHLNATDYNALTDANAQLTALHTDGSPTFDDLTISNPSSIYSLSHNSFADYEPNEHIDWTNASENFDTSGNATIGGDLTVSGNASFAGDGTFGSGDNSIYMGKSGDGVIYGKILNVDAPTGNPEVKMSEGGTQRCKFYYDINNDRFVLQNNENNNDDAIYFADPITASGRVTFSSDTSGIDHTDLSNIGTNTHAQIDTFIASKGSANGLAELDAAGKVPATQLPSSIMEYKGTWNASTNTPTLADGDTDNAGNVYRVSVAGSQDLGSGSISFDVGDYAICNDSGTWEKSDTTDAVATVNGYTGNVTLDADDIADGATKAIITLTQEANFETAYIHSQDNSQAHSDYLINNGDDTTSGSLTASNFYVGNGGFVGISGAAGWTFDSSNGDISTTSNVGIGNDGDKYALLHVTQTDTSANPTTAMRADLDWSPSSAPGTVYPAAFYLQPTIDYSSDIGGFVSSLRLFTEIAGAGAMNVRNQDILTKVTGGADVGTIREVHIRDPQLDSGTITNWFGLYVEDGSGEATNAYGVYSAGANQLNVFEGNVGIGTNPSYELDVNGDIYSNSSLGVSIAPSANFAIGANPTFTVNDASAGYYAVNAIAFHDPTANASGTVYGFRGGVRTGTGNTYDMSGAYRSLEANTQWKSSGTIDDTYGVYSTTVNVSTGTITSATGLYADFANIGGGSITNAYGLRIGNVNMATNNYAIRTLAGNIVFNDGGDANTDFRVEGDTETNLLFVDASADAVGIGTASPSTFFNIDVKEGSSVTNTNIIDLRDSTGWISEVDERIYSIKMGRTFDSPDREIEFGFVNNGASFGEDPSFFVKTAGTERFRITETGNVGIGTDSPTSFKLQVAGDVGPNADNSYDLGSSTKAWKNIYYEGTITDTSDIRYKENIDELSLGLNFINSISPISYTKIGDETERTYFGFSAQEIEEKMGGIDNSIVSYDKDMDKYRMSKLEMIAPIVKAIQEQQVQIEEILELLKEQL